MSKENKASELSTKFQQFLKENSAEIITGIEFEIYKKLPIEVELALEVIEKHGGRTVATLKIVEAETSQKK